MKGVGQDESTVVDHRAELPAVNERSHTRESWWENAIIR